MKLLIVAEGNHELGGALQTLVTRLIDKPITSISTKKISDPQVRHEHGRGARLLRKALGWIQYAQSEKFDTIVLVIDQDKDPQRHKHFDDAQKDERIPVRRALGVAVRTFDAWMLADETTLSQVLERTIQQLPDPEANRNPKKTCEDLCPQHMAQSNFYNQIAATVDVDILKKRCSNGFAPFAARVRNLAK